jgi:hypothetical protein
MNKEKSMIKWISAKKRLPETSNRILLATPIFSNERFFVIIVDYIKNHNKCEGEEGWFDLDPDYYWAEINPPRGKKL